MSEDKSQNSYRLPEKLTIVNAEHLHQMLEEHVSDGQLSEIDGQAVTQVDTAGLQILLSLKSTLRAEGTTLSFVGLSDCLKSAIKQAGLSGEFDL